MIHFTDITGLASSAVAMTALAVQFPGVARLQKPHFALLVCAIAIAVLIPFGGLPLAAYVRGWIGDLSITSLVLLIIAILNVKLAQRDFVPLSRSREITSDLPACGLSRMASSSIRAGERDVGMADVIVGRADMPVRPLLGWPPADTNARIVLLILIVVFAVVLYPMALGSGLFDPYRLGYGNTWFLGGLFLLALAACFRQLHVVALALALAVFAWGVDWYESGNLWDYLLDPLLAIYAMGAFLKQSMKSLLKSRRG